MNTTPARNFNLIVLNAGCTRFGLKRWGTPGVHDLSRAHLAGGFARIVWSGEGAENVLEDTYRRINGGCP